MPERIPYVARFSESRSMAIEIQHQVSRLGLRARILNKSEK
jgi:hypothetical protein